MKRLRATFRYESLYLNLMLFCSHFHAFLQAYFPTNDVMCQRPRDVWVILGYVFWKLQKEFIDCRALIEGHPFGLFLFRSPSKRNLWLKVLFTQSGFFFPRNKRGTEGEKVVRAIYRKVKRMKRLRKKSTGSCLYTTFNIFQSANDQNKWPLVNVFKCYSKT